MKQKNIKRQIAQLLSGELTDPEKTRLRELLTNHPEYGDLLNVHDLLNSIDHYTPPVPDDQLDRMRNDVLHTIRLQKNDSARAAPDALFERLRVFFMRPEMAVAALTLIIGFFLGRNFPVSGESMTGQFIRQINSLASRNTQLTDVKNSPYTYSNVSFREVDQQNIELSFDVTTHLDLVKPKDDPVVREVIAQTLLNPSNVGSELKAISFSESIIDQRVKQALVFSMLNAPILAVRQKAEKTLIDYPIDSEVRQAFMAVLRDEEAVQMRLAALDYLIKHRIPPDSIRTLIDGKYLHNSPAVLFKAQKYLDKIF